MNTGVGWLVADEFTSQMRGDTRERNTQRERFYILAQRMQSAAINKDTSGKES